jgi:hypothetical protein
MRYVLGFLCLAWMSDLLGCRVEVTRLDEGSGDRVGNASFSIELPPGGGWNLACTGTILRLERLDHTGFHSRIGRTVIEVREHPLPANTDPRSVEELARQFIQSEKAKYLGLGREFVFSPAVEKGTWDLAKPLFGIAYSASSPEPLDNQIWGHDISEVRREIYVYFPKGSSGPVFFSFDIIVARSEGWTSEWESLRWIDGVIRSFQWKESLKEPAPIPSPEVNP